LVGDGGGVVRGDRNRNARLARLRELVLVQNAMVGIDLADSKLMVVVCDHDFEGAGPWHVPVPRLDLGAGLDWAGEWAAAQGFTGAMVSCEPTTGGGSSDSSRWNGRCRWCACSRR